MDDSPHVKNKNNSLNEV